MAKENWCKIVPLALITEESRCVGDVGYLTHLLLVMVQSIISPRLLNDSNSW